MDKYVDKRKKRGRKKEIHILEIYYYLISMLIAKGSNPREQYKAQVPIQSYMNGNGLKQQPKRKPGCTVH